MGQGGRNVSAKTLRYGKGPIKGDFFFIGSPNAVVLSQQRMQSKSVVT